MNFDLEVIVSDNCSPDRTSQLLNSWKFTNTEIIFTPLINVENLGIITNIERIICSSKSEWLFWCTDDDILLPGFTLEIQKILSDSSVKLDFVKFPVITFLEQTKYAFYYGSGKDNLSGAKSVLEFLEIHKFSHVLTGTFVRRRLTLDFELRNVYPMSVWCSLAADKAGVTSNPIALHVYENITHWEKDLDVSSQIVKQNTLSRDFQKSLLYLGDNFSDLESKNKIYKYIFMSDGFIVDEVLEFLATVTRTFKIKVKYQKHFGEFKIKIRGKLRNLI